MPWKKVELGELVNILSGFAFKSKRFNDSGNGLPIIRVRDVGKPKSNTFFDGDYPNEFIVSNGDMLIAMDGEFRVSRWQGGKALLNQRVCKITPINHNLDSNYLYYFLPKELKRIEDRTSFATVKHLSVKKINATQIPLPPLPEQRRLAALLDRADALRRRDEALLEQYEGLGRSVFLEMFGDPVRNERGWEIIKLEDLLVFLTSGSRGWAKYYSESGALFLRINNVGKNKLKLDDIVYVKAPYSAESRRTTVEAGDVIMSITADLGRTAVIPKSFPKAHINQHLAILRLNPKAVDPVFVSQYISSIGGQHQIMKLDKGGVKAGLNFADIKSMEIPVPPLSLQNHFARIIENLESQKEKVRAQRVQSEALFQGLLQRAFRGDI